MIDKMIRCRNLDTNDQIECLCQWFEKCPPQGVIAHWVDGKSEKETAKHWVHTIPEQFKNIVSEFNLKFKICSPEYVLRFDNYGGYGRNHDLLIIAEDNDTKKVLIAFESKADEAFRKTVLEAKEDAEIEDEQNPDSMELVRIGDLRYALFKVQGEDLFQLRYQLLTAIAGTLYEAKEQNADKAIFIVQTFISDETNWDNYRRNQDDLNSFIDQLSDGQITVIHEGILVGPIKVPGDGVFIPEDMDLYIGKYSIEI